MNLIDLYKSLLKTANLTSTDDGCISMTLAKSSQPAMVKGKRLVLPLQTHLANPNKSEIVIFHPLSEHISRGESDVLEKFRSALTIRLNYTIGILGFQLLQIAASVGEHAKLSPDQSEFLSKVKFADEKTLDTFTKVMAAMPATQTAKSFISIYLKRGAMLMDKKYPRAGIVSFPLYKELKTNEKDVFGVKVRVKDRETLINLLEYIFPQIDTENAYSYGSTSEIAPFLHALMQSVLKLASPLNDLLTLFQDKMDGAEDLLFEDGWVETFENLNVMLPEIRKIPMQSGNEGVSAATPGGTVPVTNGGTGAATSTTPVQNPPAHQQQGHWTPPVQQFQNHNAFQQQQFQNNNQGGIVRTNNGLDFNSILRSNPAVGAAVGHVGNPHQQQFNQFGNGGGFNGRASLSNSSQQQFGNNHNVFGRRNGW